MKTLLEKLKQLLQTLRIFDPDGTLSLTSVALAVVLYKLATSSDLSFAELGAFLVAVGQYTTKKMLNKPASTEKAISELKTAMVATTKALHERVQVVENRTAPQVRR